MLFSFTFPPENEKLKNDWFDYIIKTTSVVCAVGYDINESFLQRVNAARHC